MQIAETVCRYMCLCKLLRQWLGRSATQPYHSLPRSTPSRALAPAVRLVRDGSRKFLVLTASQYFPGFQLEIHSETAGSGHLFQKRFGQRNVPVGTPIGQHQLRLPRYRCYCGYIATE
jgi:hypothetical protein